MSYNNNNTTTHEPFSYSADALAKAWPNIDLKEGLTKVAKDHDLSEGSQRLLRRMVSRLAALLHTSFTDVLHHLDAPSNDFKDVLTLSEATVVKPQSLKLTKGEREKIAAACDQTFILVRDGFITDDHLSFSAVQFATGASHGCVRACWRLVKLLVMNEVDLRGMTLDQALDELSFTAKAVLVFTPRKSKRAA